MSADDPEATDAPEPGTPATLTAIETLAIGRGRLTVEPTPVGEGWCVEMKIHAEKVSGRVLLPPEEARAVADQLATAAAEADAADPAE